MATTVFDLGEDGKWLRTGECSRCGECCRGFQSLDGISHISGDLRDVLSASAPLDGYCAVLRDIRGELTCMAHEGGSCSLYDEECASFPRHPNDVAHIPACTYHFERI